MGSSLVEKIIVTSDIETTRMIGYQHQRDNFHLKEIEEITLLSQNLHTANSSSGDPNILKNLNTHQTGPRGVTITKTLATPPKSATG